MESTGILNLPEAAAFWLLFSLLDKVDGLRTIILMQERGRFKRDLGQRGLRLRPQTSSGPRWLPGKSPWPVRNYHSFIRAPDYYWLRFMAFCAS